MSKFKIKNCNNNVSHDVWCICFETTIGDCYMHHWLQNFNLSKFLCEKYDAKMFSDLKIINPKCVCVINSWFETEEQAKICLDEFVEPLFNLWAKMKTEEYDDFCRKPISEEEYERTYFTYKTWNQTPILF
ncbi:MAG: hypothetical protein WCJ62_13465 [Flavobacterium sp.]